MSEEKALKSFVEVLKAANKNPRVAPGVTAQVQQAKFKNKVTSNRPTKRAAGRGG
jgi:hypothetical protein